MQQKYNQSCSFDQNCEQICKRYVSEFNGAEEKLTQNKPVSLTWMQNGKYCLLGFSGQKSKKGEINLIDVIKLSKEKYYNKIENGLGGVKLMRDGKTILVADKSGKISFLEFSGKLQERIDKPSIDTKKEGITEITSSPSDEKIAFGSGSDDKKIYILDVVSQQVEDDVNLEHRNEITCVEWHPYKALILSTSKDQSIKLWCPQQKVELTSIMCNNIMWNAKWHQNGNWFIACGKENLVKLFDIRKSEKEVESYICQSDVKCINWHPQYPEIFVSGEDDGTVKQWIASENKPIFIIKTAPITPPVLPQQEIQRPLNSIIDVGYHPLGNWLAVFKEDKRLLFFERDRETIY